MNMFMWCSVCVFWRCEIWSVVQCMHVRGRRIQ